MARQERKVIERIFVIIRGHKEHRRMRLEDVESLVYCSLCPPETFLDTFGTVALLLRSSRFMAHQPVV